MFLRDKEFKLVAVDLTRGEAGSYAVVKGEK